MHIMEGYLPIAHAAAWTAGSAPFVVVSVRHVKKQLEDHPEAKLLLGASGAFAFVLSALKLPSVTGSSSHPTGTGLGAILFGSSTMTLLGTLVLLFQALLLAHGGLTTLGANAFSMAIVGPWVAATVFKLVRWSSRSLGIATFLAGSVGNLATYVVTTFQLALAFPDASSGFLGALVKFSGVFALTQIPIALSEGLLTVLVVNFLVASSKQELQGLGLVAGEVSDESDEAV